MKIDFSIITPSLNQAQFIGECLKSVSSQTYKALEHIVLDPGSTDGSREIVSEKQDVKLVAEPDDGQCDAINKGFSMANGNVIAWLNSDDCYYSDKTLELVANRFREADSPDVVYGRAVFVDEKGQHLRDAFINSDPNSLLEKLQHQVGIIQPSVFIKKEVFDKIGGLDLSYEFALDYEYWTRITKSGFKWAFIDEMLSSHRWWSEMKTASSRDKSLSEHCRVCQKHYGYAHWLWIHRLADCVVGGVDGIIGTDTGDIDPMERARKIASYHLKYNALDRRARSLLLGNRKDNHIGETYADMVNHGIDVRETEDVICEIEGNSTDYPPTWKSHDIVRDDKELWVGYKFSEDLKFSIAKCEYESELKKSKNFFLEEKAKRTNKTCIVVGNGPSLNKTNLSNLSGVDLIISNFAYYKNELLLKAKYLTIVNDLVMRQAAYDLPNLRSVNKVFPIWLLKNTVPQENSYYVNAILKPEFSLDVNDWISWRSTVSFFNLQLAVFLGYEKILLVGFDNSYTQQKDLKEGDTINQTGDDQNHFMAEYFKGKEWQAADTNNMTAVYEIAKDAVEDLNTEIVNCTVGGKLEVFRRGTIDEEII